MSMPLRYLLSRPVLAHRAALLKSFLQRAKKCRATQQKTLIKAMAQIQGSDFERDYGLEGIKTIEELRTTLPIAGYERVEGYVKNVIAGNKNSLFAKNVKIEMFAKTSGTTNASKYIPVTTDHLNNYKNCMNIWARSTADIYPDVSVKYSVLNLTSTWKEEILNGTYKCGSITGILFAKTHNMMRAINAIPPQLAEVSDPQLKYYLILRVALANPNIAVLTTANPTTLIRLAKWMDDWKTSLIKDIFDGTLYKDSQYEAHIKRAVYFKLRADKKRARELEKVVNSQTHLYPKDAWPNLQLLSVWMGGTLGSYTKFLPQYYGQTGLRDHGLSASEAKITIPFEDYTSSGLLNVDGAYFEFIDIDNSAQQDPKVYSAHELVVGKQYMVILTNLAGLLRYNLNDIVECTDYYGEAPFLKFLNKGSQISNLTGEKLSAHQIDNAIKLALNDRYMVLSQYSLMPYVDETPGYQFVYETRSGEPIGDSFLGILDEHLQSVNSEYKDKRVSQRLNRVIGLQLKQGSWLAIRDEHVSKNRTNIEQYKQPSLILDPILQSKIKGMRK